MPSDLSIPTPRPSSREEKIAESHRKAGNYAAVYPNVYDTSAPDVAEKIGLANFARGVAENEAIWDPKVRAQEADTSIRNLAASIAGLPADTLMFLYDLQRPPHAPSTEDSLLEAFGSERLATQFGGDPEHASFLPAQILAPGPGELKAMMVGVRGMRTANRMTHLTDEVATRLQQAKPYDQTIYNETGWYKAEDGNFRFWISDSQASLNKNKIIKHPYIKGARDRAKSSGKEQDEVLEFRLEELLNHEEIYSMYPQLRNLRVNVNVRALPDGTAQMYIPGRGNGYGNMTRNRDNDVTGINVFRASLGDSAPDSLKSLLLHEVQHTIQSIEGYARGGTATLTERMLGRYQAAKSSQAVIDAVEQGVDNTDDLYWHLVNNGFKEDTADMIVRDSFTSRYLAANAFEDADTLWDLELQASSVLRDAENEVGHVLEYLGRTGDESVGEVVEMIGDKLEFEDIRKLGGAAYRNLLGEAEARLTELLRNKQRRPAVVPNPKLHLKDVNQKAPLSVRDSNGPSDVEQFEGWSEDQLKRIERAREVLDGITVESAGPVPKWLEKSRAMSEKEAKAILNDKNSTGEMREIARHRLTGSRF